MREIYITAYIRGFTETAVQVEDDFDITDDLAVGRLWDDHVDFGPDMIELEESVITNVTR